jgi:hypothetical protein
MMDSVPSFFKNHFNNMVKENPTSDQGLIFALSSCIQKRQHCFCIATVFSEGEL